MLYLPYLPVKIDFSTQINAKFIQQMKFVACCDALCWPRAGGPGFKLATLQNFKFFLQG
jgi:hypothetical protein